METSELNKTNTRKINIFVNKDQRKAKRQKKSSATKNKKH